MQGLRIEIRGTYYSEVTISIHSFDLFRSDQRRCVDDIGVPERDPWTQKSHEIFITAARTCYKNIRRIHFLLFPDKPMHDDNKTLIY